MSVVGRVVFWMWGALSSEWGELSSESGASCLGESFLWGELSWGELSLGRVVRNPFQRVKTRVSIVGNFQLCCSYTKIYSCQCHLFSFFFKDICPREKCCLGMSRLNKHKDWSTLCLVDVMSLRRLLNIMAEHVF